MEGERASFTGSELCTIFDLFVFSNWISNGEEKIIWSKKNGDIHAAQCTYYMCALFDAHGFYPMFNGGLLFLAVHDDVVSRSLLFVWRTLHQRKFVKWYSRLCARHANINESTYRRSSIASMLKCVYPAQRCVMNKYSRFSANFRHNFYIIVHWYVCYKMCLYVVLFVYVEHDVVIAVSIKTTALVVLQLLHIKQLYNTEAGGKPKPTFAVHFAERSWHCALLYTILIHLSLPRKNRKNFTYVFWWRKNDFTSINSPERSALKLYMPQHVAVYL